MLVKGLVLAVVLIASSCVLEDRSEDDSVALVALVNLFSNPEEYEGKHIRITGCTYLAFVLIMVTEECTQVSFDQNRVVVEPPQYEAIHLIIDSPTCLFEGRFTNMRVGDEYEFTITQAKMIECVQVK